MMAFIPHHEQVMALVQAHFALEDSRHFPDILVLRYPGRGRIDIRWGLENNASGEDNRKCSTTD